MAIGSDTRFTT